MIGEKKISLCAVSVCNNIVTKNDDWNVHPLDFLNETGQCFRKAPQRKVSAPENRQAMTPAKII